MRLARHAALCVTAVSVHLALGSALRAQSSAGDASRAVWAVHAGRGQFARTLDVETGSTSISVPLIGAAVELSVGGRMRLVLSAGAGALLGGTQGGSTSSGRMADAAAIWLVTPTRYDWGVFAGPGVTHTRFGAARTGVGVVISAGVRRGIGPRLTLRSHAMSGDELGVATRVEFGLVLTR